MRVCVNANLEVNVDKVNANLEVNVDKVIANLEANVDKSQCQKNWHCMDLKVNVDKEAVREEGDKERWRWARARHAAAEGLRGDGGGVLSRCCWTRRTACGPGTLASHRGSPRPREPRRSALRFVSANRFFLLTPASSSGAGAAQGSF